MELLKDHTLDINSLRFLNYLDVDDANYLKLFHKELFPIAYGIRFINDLITGKTRVLILKGVVNFTSVSKEIIIGFITFWVKKCDPKYLSLKESISGIFSEKSCIHICTLGILLEFWKMKLGCFLMEKFEEVISQIPEVKYISLECVSYNHAAINYYKKNGFKEVDKKCDYYFINDK